MSDIILCGEYMPRDNVVCIHPDWNCRNDCYKCERINKNKVEDKLNKENDVKIERHKEEFSNEDFIRQSMNIINEAERRNQEILENQILRSRSQSSMPAWNMSRS